MARGLQRVTGEITAKNDRGVKLGDTWYNLSRWAERVDPHEVGDRVELGLDSKGFVRTLTRLAQGSRNSASGASPSNGVGARGVSDEWVRVQALTLALQYAQVANLSEFALLDLYELAEEFERVIRGGFQPQHTEG
jgi:hypothetical protein